MRSYLFTRGYEGDSMDTLGTFEPQAVAKEVWDTLMIYIADTVTWDAGRTGEIIWNVGECLQHVNASRTSTSHLTDLRNTSVYWRSCNCYCPTGENLHTASTAYPTDTKTMILIHPDTNPLSNINIHLAVKRQNKIIELGTDSSRKKVCLETQTDTMHRWTHNPGILWNE